MASDRNAARSANQQRFAVFRQPAFRLYFIVICHATLGVWIFRFLLGWMAWELTHSALWVGITSGMLLAPSFLLSPLFGVVSDRVNPRNGMVITSTSNGLACLSLTLLFAQQWITPLTLLLVALVFGCITAAHQPMRFALIPRILDREALPGAIGWSAIVFNTSRIAGPAVSAALLNALSPAWAGALAAVLFLVAASVLSRIPCDTPQAPAQPNGFFGDLFAGFRFIRSDGVIRLVFLLTLINGWVGRTLLELLPALSGTLADGSAESLALLTAMAGLGSIAGGWIIARQRGQTQVISTLVYVGLLASSALLLPLGWWHGLSVLVVVVLLASLAMTVVGTGCQALVQLAVADQYRGRVMSVWTVIAMGGPSVGAFVIGALADRFGFAATLVGLALAAILVTLLSLRRRARFQVPVEA